jgi:hypothetical protein
LGIEGHASLSGEVNQFVPSWHQSDKSGPHFQNSQSFESELCRQVQWHTVFLMLRKRAGLALMRKSLVEPYGGVAST